MSQTSDTVSLRITLRYKDLEEFSDRYAENVSSAGLFIRTKSPKPTGTKIRFELLLADGSRALRGEGVVVTVRKEDKPGMALRFNLLDADSQAVIDKIVEQHGQGALAPTPLSTAFRSPSGPTAEARRTSVPGWRPGTGQGWASARTPLPRNPSKNFEREASSPGLSPPRPPSSQSLPRVRSSVPRPWATRAIHETTDKIRIRDIEPKIGREPNQDDDDGMVSLDEHLRESERTQRLEMNDLRSALDEEPKQESAPLEVVVREPISRGDSLTPEEIALAVMDAASVAVDESPQSPAAVLYEHEEPVVSARDISDEEAVISPSAVMDWGRELTPPGAAPLLLEVQPSIAEEVGVPEPASLEIPPVDEPTLEAPRLEDAMTSELVDDGGDRTQPIDAKDAVAEAFVPEPPLEVEPVAAEPVEAAPIEAEPIAALEVIAPEPAAEIAPEPVAEIAPEPAAEIAPEPAALEVIAPEAIAAEHPATEPIATEPMAESIASEPIAAEPIAAEPIVDEAIASEPIAAEPIVDEAIASEAIAAEPIASEPIADEPIEDEPVAHEPVAHEPVAVEPIAAEPAIGDAAEAIPTEPSETIPSGIEPVADDVFVHEPLASLAQDQFRAPDFHDEVTDSAELAPQPIAPTPEAEAPLSVNLEAATEIVRTFDALPPTPSIEKTPLLSTEVRVTGFDPAEQAHARKHDSKPPVGVHRTIVEKSGSHVGPSAEKPAAPEGFNEEATLVPAERAAPEPERSVVLATPDEPKRTGPERIVGIDLGARWIRIGVMTQHEFELIPAGGSVYIPALVAMKRDGTLAMGAKAKAIALEDPARVVSPRAALHALASGVVNPKRAAPSRIVSYEGGSALLRLGDRTIGLLDLLISFFGWMGKAIDEHLGSANFRAVLSVPTDLDPEARMLLKRACTEAGFRIARLESEPNAAVRAYNLTERTVSSMLLVDLGASHLGITLAKREGEEFVIAASAWFDDISARDIDIKIADLACGELEAQFGENHRSDPVSLERLIEGAEKARLDIRRAPTVELKVTLPAPGGASGVGVERTIFLPRARIYEVAEELTVQVCGRAQQVLREAATDARTVGAILLAGSGGTYPPLGQALHNLTTIEPLIGIPPTHLFAHGLAKSGQVLERQASSAQPDALSASIGLELPGGRFRSLVNAGEKLPARLVRPYPVREGQSEIELRLYQGDAELVRSCTSLGMIHLEGLPKRGLHVELEMTVDADGILDVTLRESSSGLSQHLKTSTKQTSEEKKKAMPRATVVPPDAGAKKAKGGGFLSKLFGRR